MRGNGNVRFEVQCTVEPSDQGAHGGGVNPEGDLYLAKGRPYKFLHEKAEYHAS